MTHSRSAAERLDRALDGILTGQATAAAGAGAGVDAALRPLVDLAGRLHAALPAVAVSSRFEARLGARLAAAAQQRDALAWALGHPGRLIVTGAVGSAVGVGVTAYAVWRSNRRPAPGLHR